MNKFSFYLGELLTTLFFFLPKKYRENIFDADDYREKINKIKQVFKVGFKKQLDFLINV